MFFGALQGSGGGGPAPNPAYQILVKTDNAGTSNDDQFTLPATGSYTVDWGDGVVEDLSGAQTHTYPASGDYVIKVTGGLQRINFNNGGDRLKLLQIQNWGIIAWTSMQQAYFGCSNMVGTFTDAPDLSGVTNCSSMFQACTVFNSPIGNWNTSAVTTIASMFNGAAAFNQNIGSWNTSSVTSLLSTFQGATVFNQPIGSWNTAAVTNMFAMFQNAAAFNQNLGAWNLRLAGLQMTNTFLNANALSTENYSRTLIGWANYVSANSNTPASVTLGGGTRTYNNTAYTVGETYNDAVAARAFLASASPGPAWTITDGGEV
jgi:surface protein